MAEAVSQRGTSLAKQYENKMTVKTETIFPADKLVAQMHSD